ncbi:MULTISPECIES: sensor histidine kinase [unclassified Streptomyces]|uniref:sensor histidine kinase n=1 Tax=unclassified Streptomyces TaxID=2593676 RepID=UPI0035DD3307
MTGAGYAVLVLLLLGAGFLLGRRTARPVRTSDVGTPVEHATFETLHTASLAAPPLRAGLTEESARKSARRLRSLLGTDALCLTDRDRVLVWDGEGEHHGRHVMDQVRGLLASGRDTAFHSDCDDLDCPLRWAVAVPLTVDHRVLGTLIAYAPRESAVLARAAGEVARWVCVQLELAELDRSRTQLIEAEIRALRAQISPHFIFNSLAAIASFVRTDPERARELLLEFADFTRYSFRRHGDFTTLADELHSIDQYLALVRARFGERLAVTLQVAPEVLPVALPFLCLQPLVENAVKHGLEGAVSPPRPLTSGRAGEAPIRITISALDAGSEAEVVIEDDGAGMDPERLRHILRGEGGHSTGIGLLNVDERLRQVYGDDYGLVIETGLGAGMRITVRLPKYRAGVHGS